jgi:hypothetical protein
MSKLWAWALYGKEEIDETKGWTSETKVVGWGHLIERCLASAREENKGKAKGLAMLRAKFSLIQALEKCFYIFSFIHH